MAALDEAKSLAKSVRLFAEQELASVRKRRALLEAILQRANKYDEMVALAEQASEEEEEATA